MYIKNGGFSMQLFPHKKHITFTSSNTRVSELFSKTVKFHDVQMSANQRFLPTIFEVGIIQTFRIEFKAEALLCVRCRIYIRSQHMKTQWGNAFLQETVVVSAQERTPTLCRPYTI